MVNRCSRAYWARVQTRAASRIVNQPHTRPQIDGSRETIASLRHEDDAFTEAVVDGVDSVLHWLRIVGARSDDRDGGLRRRADHEKSDKSK